MTADDIPGFVAIELSKDAELQARVAADSGLPVDQIVANASEKLAADQAAQAGPTDWLPIQASTPTPEPTPQPTRRATRAPAPSPTPLPTAIYEEYDSLLWSPFETVAPVVKHSGNAPTDIHLTFLHRAAAAPGSGARQCARLEWHPHANAFKKEHRCSRLSARQERL